MASWALKVGLLSLSGCSVAFGTNQTASGNTTTTTTLPSHSASTTVTWGTSGLSLLDGSVYCRTLPCTWANAESNPQASCPAADCLWSASKSMCEPTADLAMAVSIGESMGFLFGDSIYGQFVEEAEKCRSKDQTSCIGNCVWGSRSCGPGAGLFLSPEWQPVTLCMLKSTQQECTSAGCMWSKNAAFGFTGCFPSKANATTLYGCTVTATPYVPPTTPPPSDFVDSIYCRRLQCMYANSQDDKQASCSRGECVWNSRMSSCTGSEMLLRAWMDADRMLMFGMSGPFARFIAQQDACSKTAKAVCTGDCQWYESRGECDQSHGKIMEFSNAYAQEMEEMSNCSSWSRSEEGCVSSGCVWAGTSSMPGCYPKQATMYKLYGCDAAAAATGSTTSSSTTAFSTLSTSANMTDTSTMNASSANATNGSAPRVSTTTPKVTTTPEGITSAAAPEPRAWTAAAAALALGTSAWVASLA